MIECIICFEDLSTNLLCCDKCSAKYCNTCIYRIKLRCVQCNKIISLNTVVGDTILFRTKKTNYKFIKGFNLNRNSVNKTYDILYQLKKKNYIKTIEYNVNFSDTKTVKPKSRFFVFF